MKPKEYCQCDFPLIRNGEYCGICGLDIETDSNTVLIGEHKYFLKLPNK